MEKVTEDHNKKYFDRWRSLLINSPFKVYYRYIARKYESRFAKYGYSLITGLDVDGQTLREVKSLCSSAAAVVCWQTQEP